MRKNHLLRKRIFSIIMTLIMVVSLIPANVWADEIANDGNLNVQDVSNTDSDPNAVDANSNEHTNHCVCGKTHQGIGDHDGEDKRTFTEWTETDSLPTSGKYYLTEDVTLTDSWQLIGGGVTLCLNGHTVNVKGRATIKVNGGATLMLTDCADQQGTIQGSGQPGIEITGSKDTTSDTIYPASFMMYGGTITGFEVAVKVGDMYSEGESKFTMYGGKITDNSTKSAAAVSGLAKSTHTGDTLPSSIITMYGGEIFGNTGEAGGGVYIGDNCTFNMEGGKISNNEAKGRDVSDSSVTGAIPVHNGGGGVYLDSWGKFYMTGGEISDNKASGVGGGVCVMSYVTSYAVSITGGKITGNESTDNSGGGIYGGPAKLTIQNTEISNNKCAGNGGGIFTTQPLTLESVQITGNTASTNGGYEGGGIKIGGTSDNYESKSAVTVSGNTSISGNSPNNYYVNQSYLLPVKVSGALSDDAQIGICLNKDTASDDNFLPTTTSNSVVATAAEGVTLSANNFFADSYNSDYVVRADTSGNVTFGLCDHVMDDETGYTCRNCHTKFVAVLTQEGQKDEYIRDLSGVELSSKTGTLKLLQDAVLTGILKIYSDTLTLDLNGHTIRKNGDYLRDIILGDTSSMYVIDSSENDTANRMLDVNFNVRNGRLVLYDGENEQGFRGTISKVELYRAGTLVSCAGTISALKLTPSQEYDSDRTWDIRLWKANNQYCTIGTIQYINPYSTGSDTIPISDLLIKNHPGTMLYGTKNGAGMAEAISGDTKIGSNGVSGDYTNLYLNACEQHEPKSASDLTCKECGAELVVKISATKNGETKVGYFSKDSRDTASWLSGYAEASAQLADWVADGYKDAKLFPLANDTRGIPISCKMTLVGTGHTGINAQVKDGADVLLEGGEYNDVTVTGGKATLKGEKYNYYGVTVRGGEAVFESGTCSGYFEMDGGTVIIKNDTTFTNTDTTAFQVNKGTLHVEGGTIKSPVKIDNPVNLTISGGTFEKAVTITHYDGKNTGTCSISGGTFSELTLSGSNYNLSNLLATGCAYYQGESIVSGETKKLTAVTVKSSHEHDIDPTTGVCNACGAKMEASVTDSNGKTDYYVTREAAVAALNAAGNGAKTLKLLQARPYSSSTLPTETHTLTSGPVTLDLNGKALSRVTFIAQEGVELTLKSETEGGSVTAVQAIGEGSKVIANRTEITNDGNVTVYTISAEKGGRLELSAGTFLDLYVVKGDGSSATLSGGLYQPSAYYYGGGPGDREGNSGTYVGAYDLLPEGYRYKKQQTNGSFSWVFNNSSKISANDTYTVAYAGVSFEKIYPNQDENYSGDTYVINLGENETAADLKLTAKATSPGTAKYSWRVIYQKDDGTTDWDTVDGSKDPNKGKVTYTGKDAATLTISNLPVGTHQYYLGYWLCDSEGNNILTGSSDPLTVVVTKHEHSWAYTAEGATITAECTVKDCYLENSNGGSVTINAPAADTLTYDGKKKQATLTWTNWVADVTKDNVENSINYTGTINNGREYNGNLAPADAGTYKASITLGAVKAESKEYTIEKATLTVTGTPVATAAYKSGLRVQEILITGLTVKCGETEVEGTWKFDISYDNLEVGNTKAYTATFTPKANKHNYEKLTKDIVPTITKGTYTNTIATTKNVFTGVAQTGVEVRMMPYIKGAAIVEVSEASDTGNIISNVRFDGEKVLFDVANVSEVGKTAIITVTYSSDNYENFTGTITVKTVERKSANVSITSLSGGSVTYGDPITLTAKKDDDTSTGGAWSWNYPNDTFAVDGAVNEASITLKPLKVTDGDVTITAKYESATHIGEGTVSITVNKKPIIVEAGTYKVSKTYDGTMDAGNPSGTLSVKGILSADSGVKVEATPVAYTDANVGVQTSMDVLIALEGTGKDNYKINGDATTITVPCEITKATLTAEGAGIASGTYGDKLSKLIISGLTAKLNDKVVNGTWRLTGDTVPNVGDTGTYIATFTPATGAGNYEALTKDVKLNIAKATYGDKNATGSANFGASGVVDLSSMLVEGGNFRTLTVTDTENVLNGIPTIIDGSSLKFTFANEQSKVNKTATVTIPVTSTNYDDYDIIVTVTVKETPSGGGGGAVIPTTEVVTKDKTTTSPGDVKTETKIGTDGNKETISKVTVSDDNQKEIIKQVKDNKSEEIIINVSEKDISDGASLEINLDKEFIDSIVNDTDAKLTIKTPAGDRTFTKEELKELSEASTGDTITIDPTDDDSDKAEKIAKAKELTAGLGLTARSGKTAKGNVNVVLKNSTMTKDSIKELEELGFTVKYRFYRSTKKSSGYKSMVTKNTASYTNTTGKKGTKYYYKVRVMIYDADGNLIAKSDLKQCRYAARTWSK